MQLVRYLLLLGFACGGAMAIMMGRETLTARDWRTGLVPARSVSRTMQAYAQIALGVVGLLAAVWLLA